MARVDRRVNNGRCATIRLVNLGRQKDGYTHNWGQKCRICGEVKLLSEYSSWIGKTSRLWNKMCKSCMSRETADLNRRASYKLSKDEYQKLLESSGNKCQICQREEIGKSRLAIDHCHASGEIRGLLCRRCNSGLGYFDDNLIGLMKAVAYLRNNE